MNGIDMESPEQQQINGTSTSVTLRMIMQGKEVGSIIGKKGDNVKRFREDSGAKINISDNSCPERIVTVMGSTDAVVRAFSMIARKFEELYSPLQDVQAPPGQKPSITLRLIVPASQCGSLIGKGGSKIKEIRDASGASVQVANEMLPNSTERAITISGPSEAITKCIFHMCTVFVESPPKGATIPYRPKPPMPPIIYSGGQAFALHGQFAMPAQPADMQKLQQMALPQAAPTPAALPYQLPAQVTGTPAIMAGTGPASTQAYMSGLNCLAFPRPNQVTANSNPVTATHSHEMNIPNDLIGCIIGRAGCKINEIRQFSGATIKISNCEEGSSDRKVTIQGTPDTINTAQYMINASMELHKSLALANPANAANVNTTPTSTTLTPAQNPASLAIPLQQLMKPFPQALLGLNMGLFDANSNQKLTQKMRPGLVVQQNGAAISSKKTDPRQKFAPY
ncbi:poly(rC)-binding protein 3-like isoform X2 [Lineus longissimus]|uniref:poly(rC)-binding protein 3-like isoform X2 n=1 Tax=Lineus longissimus TaxID=88925 RepID=UPI002B4DFA35